MKPIIKYILYASKNYELSRLYLLLHLFHLQSKLNTWCKFSNTSSAAITVTSVKFLQNVDLVIFGTKSKSNFYQILVSEVAIHHALANA